MKKNIIITGSSRGLGLQIAIKLQKLGGKILINGRSKSKLKQLKKKYNFFDYYAGDLSKEKNAKKFAIYAIKKMKNIDVLICNAGKSKSCSPNEENKKEWEKMFDANFYTTSNMIESTKKNLIKNRGKIICISSICGYEFIKGAPITYSAAKAALNFYVKSLSQYLSKDICINILSPGNLLFPNSVWAKKLKNDKSKTKKLIKSIPFKRLMYVDDLMGCIEFLLSSKSKYITGQNFIIDGGQTISR